jgi:hypothetical protein
VQRDQHRVGRDQGVQREQPQRRRAVDENEIELVAERLQNPPQAALAFRKRDHLDLGAGQIPIGWNQRKFGNAVASK